MAIKLSHLAARTKPLEIDFNGDIITVQYNPFDINPAFWDWMNKRTEAEDAVKATAEKPADQEDVSPNQDTEKTADQPNTRFDYDVILHVIKTWDVVDDDDHIIPITLELLQGLPSVMVAQIVTAVFEDIQTSAQKKTKKPLEDG